MKLLTAIPLSKIAAVLIIVLSLFSAAKVHSQNNLWCLEFLDDQNGITIGDNGTIKQTTNGGIDWSVKSSGTTNSLKKTALLNNDNIVVVGLGGTIVKTTDYGSSWNSKSADISTDLYGVSFGGRNSETGIAVGDKGTIIRTTDMGETWTVIASVPSAKSLIYSAVSFASETKGIIVGQKGIILITTDGGLTWFHVPSDVPHVDFKFVIMLTDDIAYATGENGTIIKTTDGGLSWISLNTNSSSTLYRVRFADDMTAISVGTNGEILKTTDAGTTWSTETSGTVNSLNCLFVIDENTALAGGQDEIMLKTTDGGITWAPAAKKITADSKIKNTNFMLYPGFPNPSNPVSTIRYYIASASVVTMKIYDAIGKEVCTLINQSLSSGYYSALFDGSNLPSGIYYCKLVARSGTGTFSQTTKLVLVK